MIDQAIRYAAILQQPEFQKSSLLLEVGSGSWGISAFIKERFIGVDAEFYDQPAAGLLAVRASALALPFREHVFERVISSDMLEHIPAGDRVQAICEMARVTKQTLIIACPCGQEALKADSLLLKLYHILKIHPPVWLLEHVSMVLPTAKSVRDTLTDRRILWREVNGEGVFTHLLISLLISSKRLNGFWQRLFRGTPARAIRWATSPLSRLGRPYRRLWVINNG